MRVGGGQFEFALSLSQVDAADQVKAQGFGMRRGVVALGRGKGGRDDEHVVAPVRFGGGVAQADLQPRLRAVAEVLVLGPQGRAHLRMVAQILANAGQVAHHVNAHRLQVRDWPDARQ